jgi:hypothetical protein
MRWHRQTGVLLRVAAVSLVVLAVAGCAAAVTHEPARPVEPSVASTDTVSRTSIGAELSITASVTSVITADAFVVTDEDLPDRGLLVFGTMPPGLHPVDLVNVRGRIVRFDFGAFAPR